LAVLYFILIELPEIYWLGLQNCTVITDSAKISKLSAEGNWSSGNSVSNSLDKYFRKPNTPYVEAIVCMYKLHLIIDNIVLCKPESLTFVN